MYEVFNNEGRCLHSNVTLKHHTICALQKPYFIYHTLDNISCGGGLGLHRLILHNTVCVDELIDKFNSCVYVNVYFHRLFVSHEVKNALL